jgi:hypothetical protein
MSMSAGRADEVIKWRANVAFVRQSDLGCEQDVCQAGRSRTLRRVPTRHGWHWLRMGLRLSRSGQTAHQAGGSPGSRSDRTRPRSIF